MLHMLNIQLYDLNKNSGVLLANKAKTKFHTQILTAWNTLHGDCPTSVHEILNQYISCNQYIKIAGKCISKNNFLINEIEKLKIYDIVNEEGNFLALNLLNQKLNCSLKPLQVMSLISAIPKIWKEKLKAHSEPMHDQKLGEIPRIKIGQKFVVIQKITNKQIVNKLLKNTIKPATSIETWINLFPFLETEDWNQIFLRTFKITKETYLQSFQYKILHRILNCNEKLYKWKIKPKDECDECGEVDSIEHHLFYCKISTKFWKQLKDWSICNLGFSIELTVCEVIFGIPTYKNPDLKIINFLILIGKWYLNNSKTKNKNIYFIDFIALIKAKIEIIKYIHASNNEEVDQWVADLWAAT